MSKKLIKKTNFLKRHFSIAIFYLLIVAVLGFLMRLYASNVIDFSFLTPYKNWVHAHSHTALLGWVYLGITSLLTYFFIPQKVIKSTYRYLFWATQLCLTGMLVFFPIQGYGAFSIIFSTLFLFVSYFFTYFFIKKTKSKLKKTPGFIVAKHALFYLVFSSLGPWFLGIVMATLGKTSIWYKLAIYFYLHFQYNAWFVLAIIGLFLAVIRPYLKAYNLRHFKRFLWLFHSGVVLSFFLSCLWTSQDLLTYLLANLGSLFTWFSFIFLALAFGKFFRTWYENIPRFQQITLQLIGSIFLIKLVMQSLSGVPYFATIAATNLDVVIGYLHWFFLGVISLSLFFLADYLQWMRLKLFYWVLFIIAFFSTEILIFYRAGIAVFNFPYISNLNAILATASLLFPVSIFFILIGSFSRIKNQNNF